MNNLLHYSVTWNRKQARKTLRALDDSDMKTVSLAFVDMLGELQRVVNSKTDRYAGFEDAFERFRAETGMSLTAFRKCVQSVGLSLKDGKCYGQDLRAHLRDKQNRANLRKVKDAHTSALKKCLVSR